MAKKTKKTKITETLVNQLQEPSIVDLPEENLPAQKPVEKKKEVTIKKKIRPQSSKLFNKPASPNIDSETAGINFGVSGVL